MIKTGRPPRFSINIGDRYNKLEIIECIQGGSNRPVRVRCDCGIEKIVGFTDVRTGKIKSCGCFLREVTKLRNREKRFDLQGETFGLLSYVEEAPDRNGYRMIKCHCACGSEVIIPATGAINGHSKSCGCLKLMISKDRIIQENSKRTRKDLTGSSFGRYIVKNESHRNNNLRQYFWNCICKICCDKKVIRSDNLKILKLPYCKCTPFKRKNHET